MKKFYVSRGFTLAEVLITLTIIGIIAALTIPNLMQKYTKHTYVVRLKNAYSEIANAVKMIPVTEGCPAGDFDCAGIFQSSGNVTNIDGKDFLGKPENKVTYLLSKNIKHKIYCDSKNASAKCKNIPAPTNTQSNAFFISDKGTVIVVRDAYTIYVDVNGQKGPNKAGRDIFAFYVAKNDTTSSHIGDVMPLGSMNGAKYKADINGIGGVGWKNYYWKFSNTGNGDYSCKPEKITVSCTARVLEESAMNY